MATIVYGNTDDILASVCFLPMPGRREPSAITTESIPISRIMYEQILEQSLTIGGIRVAK